MTSYLHGISNNTIKGMITDILDRCIFDLQNLDTQKLEQVAVKFFNIAILNG